jgi:hypothetical protein
MKNIICSLCLGSLLLSACSSDDPDRSPPTITSESGKTFSPFDTISVTFSENLKNFDSENITATKGYFYTWDGGNTVQLFGDSAFLNLKSAEKQEFPTWNKDTEYSVNFKDLEDGEGNKIEKALNFTFKTLDFIDSDFIAEGKNDQPSTADVLSQAGNDLEIGIETAGFITGSLNNKESNDNSDYYSVEFVANSDIEITLSNTVLDLEITLFGPEPEEGISQISELTKGKNVDGDQVITLEIDANMHTQGKIKTTTDYAKYWILVSYAEDFKGEKKASPYNLLVKKTN